MNRLLREYSFLFLVFLSSFLIMKTIFIIFFNTPFDPLFILHMSPLTVFSSVTDIQLLVASLFVVLLNLYLHTRIDIESVIASTILTSMMVSGLSISILSSDLSMGMILEYIVFLSSIILLANDVQGLIGKEITPILFTTGSKKVSAKIDKINAVSDLVMIDGLDKNHIEILRDIGIKNVDDLAKMNVDKIIKNFREYMNYIEKTVKDLNKEDVKNWIKAAKNLINERNKFRNI